MQPTPTLPTLGNTGTVTLRVTGCHPMMSVEWGSGEPPNVTESDERATDAD